MLFSLFACSLLFHSTASASDFLSPPATSRPLFRFWVPDAGVDSNIVAKDVQNAGAVGAGGVEFITFFNYGGEMGSEPRQAGADWGRDMFGTKKFQNMFRSALKAHGERGMKMDFALGPNQGQGVPAHKGDPGLQWDLVPASVEIGKTATSFHGTLPGWGTGKLIAVVSALVTSQQTVNLTAGPFQALPYRSYESLVIEDDSLTEHPLALVSKTGQASFQFKPTKSTSSLWLFAFFEAQTERKNVIFDRESMKTVFDNGSFAVDHFSARGAETVIRFWQDRILDDDIRRLLRKSGGNAWEDSVEVQANMSWTPSLPAQFEAQHGYKIHKYLPLLMWGNNNINLQQGSPGRVRVQFAAANQHLGYINDYRATLGAAYGLYIKRLSSWAHNIGVGLSMQPSYNLPLDIATSIPLVDIPETESLQFADNVDGYRQFTGISVLAGRNVISNEMGARFLKAYQYTTRDLLLSIHKAVAGGVNRFVLHGLQYTGPYYDTTWPGYTAFQYFFAELNSPRHPAWSNGFSDVLDYISRLSHVQQKGVRRIDVALLNKPSVTNPNFPRIYAHDDLVQNGYDYGYISTSTLDLPQSTVSNGLLGPDGPAFKALILTSQSNLTVDAIRTISQYAKSGLRIIISGSPGVHMSAKTKTEERVKSGLANLVRQRNVYSCQEGEVVKTLNTLGIRPRVTHRANGTWYTTWREDREDMDAYLFALGDANATAGTLKVSTSKIPYIYDAWTGQRRPVVRYSRDDESSTLTIPLTLAANQAIIFGFSVTPLLGVDTPKHSIAKMSPAVLDAEYSRKTGLWLKVAASDETQSVTLSDGTTRRIEKSTPCKPFALESWNLTVEHWEAPSNISDSSTIAVKRNSTHLLTSPLRSWLALSDTDLPTTSGVGFYQTTFTWPPPSCAGAVKDYHDTGAIIALLPVLQTVRLSVNGKSVPPLNPTSPVADISVYLRKGENRIIAIVPSTMWNYLRSILPKLRNSGEVPLKFYQHGVGIVTLPAPGPVDNGLIGTMSITPYRRYLVPG